MLPLIAILLVAAAGLCLSQIWRLSAAEPPPPEPSDLWLRYERAMDVADEQRAKLAAWAAAIDSGDPAQAREQMLAYEQRLWRGPTEALVDELGRRTRERMDGTGA